MPLDVTVPSDSHFRGAWTLSGNVISEDLDTAKTIFKDKIREVRAPLLEAEDVVYMKALEADDATAKPHQLQRKQIFVTLLPHKLSQMQQRLLNLKPLGIQVY